MSDGAPPPVMVTYLGAGRFKVPSEHWAKLADKHYAAGELIRILPLEERSTKSHSHYFAALNDAWKNLPDHLAVQFPSVEHLRKRALIEAGFCDQDTFVCASKAEAIRLQAFMKVGDDYTVTVCREATVTRYRAKSQSMRAMGRADFQDSKDKVLDVVSRMIGVTKEALVANSKNGGQA